MSLESQVVIQLHFYEPPREASHLRLQHINPDPQGQNWTKVATDESYRAMRDLGVLPRISYDYYGTLDSDLEKIDPDIRNAMRAHLRTNGVADSYIHSLLPDLTWEDKTILIAAGINRFIQITGKRPKFFWPPETAIDIQTAEVLADHGIEGFFCAPYQVELNDGGDPDNIPTFIRLPNGKTIFAIPFDRILSHKLAFEDDENDPLRADAYKFRDRVIMPRLASLTNSFPLLGCTDGETFGHHLPWGGGFIDVLVNHALPQAGVKVVSINDVDMQSVTTAEGKIRERTAWSCAHENLARWRGECDCGSKGLDVSWRRPFYRALHDLNWALTQLVQSKLGDGYLNQMVERFDQAFKNPGSPAESELSLISAKVAGLTAITSCGTFFEDPGVSGNINLLSARQAVEHLKDAGLKKEAATIWTQFLNTMREVHNPAYHNRSGFEMAHDLLGEIADDGYLPIAA